MYPIGMKLLNPRIWVSGKTTTRPWHSRTVYNTRKLSNQVFTSMIRTSSCDTTEELRKSARHGRISSDSMPWIFDKLQGCPRSDLLGVEADSKHDQNRATLQVAASCFFIHADKKLSSSWWCLFKTKQRFNNHKPYMNQENLKIVLSNNHCHNHVPERFNKISANSRL